MTNMLREIQEQPDVLIELAKSQAANVQAVATEVRNRGINSLCAAARGTSDNAAAYGKYAFEILNGMVFASAAPSIATTYHRKLRLQDYLYIGISQSGESPDVVESVEQARESGALTLGITNQPESKLAKVSDHVLLCCCGEEKSVAATKTYTATLGLIYMLATAIASGEPDIKGIAAAADAIRLVLKIKEEVARTAERYRYMNECLVTARGINQATCQEASLKMAETCYVVTTPYSGADVKHGPIAMVNSDMPVFLYAPSGKTEPYMLELARDLKRDGAEIVAISNVGEILAEARVPIKLDFEIDEMLSPMVYIVVGQLFAQYLSVTKGLDPDKPRNLNKITRTL